LTPTALPLTNPPSRAKYGAQNELLLAFWSSIGFKPGSFMTAGMSEQRAHFFAAFRTGYASRVAHAF
jgi:hypothetical protein